MNHREIFKMLMMLNLTISSFAAVATASESCRDAASKLSPQERLVHPSRSVRTNAAKELSSRPQENLKDLLTLIYDGRRLSFVSHSIFAEAGAREEYESFDSWALKTDMSLDALQSEIKQKIKSSVPDDKTIKEGRETLFLAFLTKQTEEIKYMEEALKLLTAFENLNLDPSSSFFHFQQAHKFLSTDPNFVTKFALLSDYLNSGLTLISELDKLKVSLTADAESARNQIHEKKAYLQLMAQTTEQQDGTRFAKERGVIYKPEELSLFGSTAGSYCDTLEDIASDLERAGNIYYELLSPRSLAALESVLEDGDARWRTSTAYRSLASLALSTGLENAKWKSSHWGAFDPAQPRLLFLSLEPLKPQRIPTLDWKSKNLFARLRHFIQNYRSP